MSVELIPATRLKVEMEKAGRLLNEYPLQIEYEEREALIWIQAELQYLIGQRDNDPLELLERRFKRRKKQQ